MAQPSPSKYWRLRPRQDHEYDDLQPEESVDVPCELLQNARLGHGLVTASWDEHAQLGKVEALGVIRQISADFRTAEIDWMTTKISLRPNPTGRRWWIQERPFFAFAKNVALRYGFDDLFAEHFPEYVDLEFGNSPKSISTKSPPTNSPTGGYFYVIRSPYGYKIGKTVNLKRRTKLFEVKLPFKISLEHYAWFDNYTDAEQAFHRRNHEKRLEGEWFDLSSSDLAAIRSEGTAVNVEGL